MPHTKFRMVFIIIILVQGFVIIIKHCYDAPFRSRVQRTRSGDLLPLLECTVHIDISVLSTDTLNVLCTKNYQKYQEHLLLSLS
jgi:hypothetical protein